MCVVCTFCVEDPVQLDPSKIRGIFHGVCLWVHMAILLLHGHQLIASIGGRKAVLGRRQARYHSDPHNLHAERSAKFVDDATVDAKGRTN